MLRVAGGGRWEWLRRLTSAVPHPGRTVGIMQVSTPGVSGQLPTTLSIAKEEVSFLSPGPGILEEAVGR